MEKLEMHTADLAKENYEKLAALFPNAVTETVDEEGHVVRAIDKDVLMQEINMQVVDDGQERYQFTWPDKRKTIMLANQPIAKTLRLDREKSVSRDGTQGGDIDSENIYIEGDNLDAMKILRETYLGKVKMIYIDPPYNTGNDFIYEDDFSQNTSEFTNNSGQTDEEGNRLVQNEGNRLVENNESNGRFHTDWLNMLYPRLRIAKDLLSDDGVIFISIDDNEQERLKLICNEIFGESNYQATITYVRKTSGKQDSSNFMNSTEYILVYSKSNTWKCRELIAGDNVLSRYNKEDADGRKYRETDLRKTGSNDRRVDRPNLYYPFYYNPSTNDLYPSPEQLKPIPSGYIEIVPVKPDGTEGNWRWECKSADEKRDLLTAHEMPKYEGKYTVYEKDYIDKKGSVRTIKEHTFWNKTEFNSDNAMQEFKNLGFSNQAFPFPKSSALLKHIVYLSNCTDGIILDFFSGSGTLAQAVLEINAEEEANRKFILVQLPEKCEESGDAFKAGFKTICDIGEERIRRAGKKIKEETGADIDYGFRCFKVDSSNMKDVYYKPADMKQDQMDLFADNIKEDRTPEDLLIQVMLDLGVLLSSKIEETEIAGKKVFSVENGYLIACFDEKVTEEVVTAIAKQHPYYAVFRDSSMADDSVAANFEQIFMTYSPQTVRKVL
ncbi:MAG: site-specific DNA-methyltransferase [Megasphaera sp.]|uniref:site-specific DNA-methyltransferase n=1 Tax=Megasphaera sp. TaxID=2023260 RepID=UPI003F0E7C47